jgi:hypothetical protein
VSTCGPCLSSPARQVSTTDARIGLTVADGTKLWLKPDGGTSAQRSVMGTALQTLRRSTEVLA